MSEERKMILQMLQEGTITVEEAERLLDAIPEGEHPSAELMPLAEGHAQSAKRLVVRVTKDGRARVNVRVPISLIKLGLKLGGSIGGVEELRGVDVDEILKSIAEGEIELPYTMVDVDDEQEGHVEVILQ